MPRLDNTDFALYRTAYDAAELLQGLLLNKAFNIKIVSQTGKYSNVYLYKKYIFGSELLNLKMLEEGYGKFINNIEPIDSSSFTEAQSVARNHKKGIWKFIPLDYSDILDIAAERKRDVQFSLDSLNYEMKRYPKPNAGNVLAELILGSCSGFFFSIAAYGSITAFYPPGRDGYKNPVPVVITVFSSFALGTSATVYGLSTNTSKKTYFGYILVSSLIAAGIGGSLSILANDMPLFYLITSIFAVLGPVLYVNVVAQDRFTVARITQTFDFKEKHLTAHELYNSTNQFNIELIRINF